MELFVIFRSGSTEPVWAKVTDAEEAERAAVVAAVNGGNCDLLSGDDLVRRLYEGAPDPVLYTITRSDVEWQAKRPVSDEEAERYIDALGNSSMPDVFAEVAFSIFDTNEEES